MNQNTYNEAMQFLRDMFGELTERELQIADQAIKSSHTWTLHQVKEAVQHELDKLP